MWIKFFVNPHNLFKNYYMGFRGDEILDHPIERKRICIQKIRYLLALVICIIRNTHYTAEWKSLLTKGYLQLSTVGKSDLIASNVIIWISGIHTEVLTWYSNRHNLGAGRSFCQLRSATTRWDSGICRHQTHFPTEDFKRLNCCLVQL